MRIVLSLALSLLGACVAEAPVRTVGDRCQDLYGAYCEAVARCSTGGVSTTEERVEHCLDLFVPALCCEGEACEAPAPADAPAVEACVADFDAWSCGPPIPADSACRELGF